MADESQVTLIVEWLLGGLLGALMLFVGWSRGERNDRIAEVAAKLAKTDAKLDNLAVTVARDYLSKAEVRQAIHDAMRPLYESLARIESRLDEMGRHE